MTPDPRPTMIPTQLCRPEFGFCLVMSRSKRPLMTAWQKNPLRHDDPALLRHIQGGGNVGIVCGYGNLRVLDADDPAFAEEMSRKVSTFTVASSRGKHFYFLTPYDQNHVLTGKRGEFRAHDQQCAIPPSIHPTGKAYTVSRNLPIISMTAEEVRDLLKDLVTPTATPTDAPPTDVSRSGREFGELIRRIKVGLRKGNLDKDEIFLSMNLYSKWATSPAAYKELSWQKAYAIASKPKEAEEEEKNPLKVVDELADQLIEKYKIKTIEGDLSNDLLVFSDGHYSPGRHRVEGDVELELGKNATASKTREVVLKIERKTFISREEFDAAFDPHFINCKNGIIDLRTGEMSPPDPARNFLYCLATEYFADAKCPEFLQFLSQVIDEAEHPRLQEWIGYLLFGDNRFKRAGLLIGERDRGKTTFLHPIMKMIGPRNISAEGLLDLCLNRFSSANLYGKVANIADELPAMRLQDASRFKALTGNSYVRGERKGRDSFSFQARMKLMFASNFCPTMEFQQDQHDDEAFFSRWMIFVFDTFDPGENGGNIDRDLAARISTPTELQGILFWAVEGAKRLLTNGRFTSDMNAQENQQFILLASSAVGRFVEAEIIKKPADAKDPAPTKAAVYDHFQTWTKEKGEPFATKEMFGRLFPRYCPWATSAQRNVVENGKTKQKAHVWQGVLFKNPHGGQGGG
ncbi:MAG: phage/plasmid primase, P4 family [Nanoarchaeota archaeon]